MILVETRVRKLSLPLCIFHFSLCSAGKEISLYNYCRKKFNRKNRQVWSISYWCLEEVILGEKKPVVEIQNFTTKLQRKIKTSKNLSQLFKETKSNVSFPQGKIDFNQLIFVVIDRNSTRSIRGFVIFTYSQKLPLPACVIRSRYLPCNPVQNHQN